MSSSSSSSSDAPSDAGEGGSFRNELAAVGGAAVTALSGLATILTLGKSDTVNKFTKDAASYTAQKAEASTVGHLVVTGAHAAETVAIGSAALLTAGQVPSLNQAAEDSAKATAESAGSTAVVLGGSVVNVLEATPGVGHVYAAGLQAADQTGKAKQVLANANHSTGVVAGAAIGGLTAGPVGLVAGMVVGGMAADAGTSAVLSTPVGTVRDVNNLVNAQNNQDRIDGAVGVASTVVNATGVSPL